MDVRFGAVAVIVVCSLCSHVASQPVNATQSVASDASNECQTAKSVAGRCVHRRRCDYGTPAIDQTLYATRGYIKPCAIEEVCCPEFATTNVEASTSPSIDSDEDDV